MLTAIEKVQRYATRIKNGKGKVRPGQSIRFPEAASHGDCGDQGDLRIKFEKTIPKHYVRIENPTDQDLQLVPGNTQGARHCLDSFQGVELYRPPEWGQDYEGLEGPAFVLSEERTIKHPTHGDVICPARADGVYVNQYQRVYDQELRRERRALD